ncbi:MAG TPA: hypothetical protein VGB85_17585, partial [Nannocystis sp.]
QPTLAPGAACDPDRVAAADTPDPEDDKDPQPICAPGLVCDPVVDSDDHVCGAALQIRGRVEDSLTGLGIEAALVAALNENGEPVTDVAATDSCGDYVLPIRVRRNPDGSFAESLKWTLIASARNYQPFPAGPRPALPIDLSEAVPNPDGPEPALASKDAEDDADPPMTYTVEVIDTAATSVALIPLGAAAQGVSVSGSVGADAAGTLVVAEGGAAPAPYAIADASGAFTLFNVQSGAVEVRGYRQGVELAPAPVTVAAADVVDVDLAIVTVDVAALGTVTGSIGIVNAPGGSMTSVVLVPSSVYNAGLERGPVPLGLRDPPPPATPDVTGQFTLTGVPAGTYKVLVAFENDSLVRDPDEGISGTQIQEITLAAGQMLPVAEGFKVTEALAIVGPGKDGPEAVAATPTLTWVDDSSEDGYDVVVYDALGNLVWETEVAGVSGSDNVELAYAGPALVSGMYYQFRVTSWREVQNKRLNIARTEDLRGVFYTGEAPEQTACVAEDPEPTGGDDTDTGGAVTTGE